VTDGWHLPPLRSGHPADAALLERRTRAAGQARDGDRFEEAEIGGVRCLIVTPAQGGAQGDMLYLHGGGYRLGSPLAYIAYARGIADACRRRLVLPFYRLAPEHPFPAALHDAVAVYRALPDPGSVVVAGDSAGAGLAAALAILAGAAGVSPAGAILVSPMLDLQARGESLERNAARDPLFSKAAVLDCAELYLQGHAPSDPLVSAIEADPSAFPPLLLLIGGAEVLLDETLDFASRLARADRRVTLHVAPGMGHVWPLMTMGTAPASEAVAAICGFVAGLIPSKSGGSV